MKNLATIVVATLVATFAIGHFADASTGSAAGGMEILQTPVRVLDTRTTDTPDRIELPGKHLWTSAAFVTVTVTNTSAAGFAVAYPCDQPIPQTSAVTWDHAHATTSALTATALAADSTICIYSSVPTDLVIDLVGWAQTPLQWVLP